MTDAQYDVVIAALNRQTVLLEQVLTVVTAPAPPSELGTFIKDLAQTMRQVLSALATLIQGQKEIKADIARLGGP